MGHRGMQWPEVLPRLFWEFLSPILQVLLLQLGDNDVVQDLSYPGEGFSVYFAALARYDLYLISNHPTVSMEGNL